LVVFKTANDQGAEELALLAAQDASAAAQMVPAVEPQVDDPDRQRLIGEQAHDALDVIGIDVAHDHQFETPVAGRQCVQACLEMLVGGNRATVDEQPARARAVAVFDEQTVAVQCRQHFDAKKAAVLTQVARRGHH
jgi:hypothetical protein